MTRRRWFSWAAILLLLAGAQASPPPRAQAHADPPGPPYFVERIVALSAVVLDDTDPVGAGEIFLDWRILPPPPHAVEVGGGRLPGLGTLAVSAPPAVNLFPRGATLWVMGNCMPLERPVNQTVLLRDDDNPFGVEDLINIAAGVPAGVTALATPLGSVTLSFTWVQAPQRNFFCKPPESDAGRGPMPAEPITSFSHAEPGPYAFLQPTQSITFTFKFTNTFILSDTFVFDVDVPKLEVPDPAELDPLRGLGTVIFGTASWGTITTPGAATGLPLDPGEVVDLELLISIPGGTPFGYYQLGLGGSSQTFALDLVPEHVILEVRDQPLGPRRLNVRPADSR